MSMLVRLKPLSERKGHKVQIYTFAGLRFYERQGWYEVEDGIAEQLRNLHQDHYDEETPDLFDVCTREEAQKLDEKERQAAERSGVANPAQAVRTRVQKPASTRRDAESSGDMSTEDLDAQREAQLNPPDDEEDGEPAHEGRLAGIGRVAETAEPRTRGGKRK